MRGTAVDDLHTIRDAIEALPPRCRYHGDDFAKLGMEWGQPRCDSCKDPYRRKTALSALNRSRWAADVFERDRELPAGISTDWAQRIAAAPELYAIDAVTTARVARSCLPPGWALVRLASISAGGVRA
jgi:hypothetical protein